MLTVEIVLKAQSIAMRPKEYEPTVVSPRMYDELIAIQKQRDLEHHQWFCQIKKNNKKNKRKRRHQR